MEFTKDFQLFQDFNQLEVPSEAQTLPEIEIAPLDLHQSPTKLDTQESQSGASDSFNKSSESLDSKKSSETSTPVKNRRKRKPNVTKKVSTSDVSFSDIDIEASLIQNVITCEVKRNDNESDDCETIDKIAQMVSNITSTDVQASVAAPAGEEEKLSKSNNEMIEDQLEQMFADSKDGLPPTADSELNKLPDILQDGLQSDSPKDATKKKSPTKPKASRKKKAEGLPDKKKKQGTVAAKLKNGKTGRKGKKPQESLDTVKSESKVKSKENGGKSKIKPDVAPFLQIQKDGSFAIVNQTVNRDDDAEKSVNKPKKSGNVEKNKVIRGLHVSTLSNKYDADKRDATWICVFCKMGPHKFKLGDLFGPYIVNKTSEDFKNCLQDPASDIFRQKNKNKFVKEIASPPTSPEKPSKKKRKLTDTSARNLTSPTGSRSVGMEEVFNGMSKIDDNNFEVWFHEDCLVHSNGVYIVGTKLVGMEAAIWSSTRYRCEYCDKNGAMLSCLNRQCHKNAHFGCAKKTWKLDEEFKTFCELHH